MKATQTQTEKKVTMNTLAEQIASIVTNDNDNWTLEDLPTESVYVQESDTDYFDAVNHTSF